MVSGMNYLSENLSSNDIKAVEIFVKRLLSEFGPDVIDVRLYGSKARDEAAADSDLDLLVLVHRPDYALKHAILWLAAEVSLAWDVLLSPRVIPYDAWRQMIEAETLFYRTICAEGISLMTSSPVSKATQQSIAD